MHDLVNHPDFLPTLLWLIASVYIGPTLLGAFRQVNGLGLLFVSNVFCLIMPPLLLVSWWMAFKLPSKEPR